ncbi:MAG: MlaD family protein [Pseudanabaena sp.]|nr:MCE family protein [Pseudanabaena sp. M051S1SP2A07QC]MCA6589939.1 MCE family protein [Pseudanabaena sp. M109S1SP1A06QC]MCA6603810.1 MCE family protein [Pseudanabaena sp. M007S1SP1A06QC]MCA6611575.1 MCE family protein [Pseudanabaena sp. M158S2SP1A06QC]MCA6614161.1 MCE family protein [Pseudanabaena sp. M090S1SP1A06QC]MCA6622776.1 MCE family protein [Pseudanabaena sp. M165S2SP1A06QC]MCE2976134.1 MlaD family protein [Pseudanabaena sp. CoA8_M7]
MQRKTLRDGALGLFIIGGVVALGGALLWLRGQQLNSSKFTFTIKLPDASGLNTGSVVRFRGVEIGRVTALTAQTDSVDILVTVENSKLIIPKLSVAETNQSGFLGNTNIDIFPPKDKVTLDPNLNPLAKECNNDLIVCQGGQIEGSRGVSFTLLLKDMSATLRKINDQGLIDNLNDTLNSAKVTAKSIQKLTDSANRVVGTFENQIVKFGDTADAISGAANKVGSVANSAQDLIEVNREKLAQTLDGIAAASREARSLLASAKPLLNDGKLIANLQKLADNAAETSANLRKVTGELSDPATIASLRETLDSARATFANAKKITADLDELTGDPQLRNNIRNLINGLGGLLSTAPNLDNLPTPSNSRPSETATEKLPTNIEVARSKLIKPAIDDRERREKSLEQEKVKINSPTPMTTISKTTKSESSTSTEASSFINSSSDQ